MKIWHKIFLFGLALLTLNACKDDDVIDPPNRGNSFLHIVNGATSVDTFNLVFDYWNASNVVIEDFYHTRNFPISGYAQLEEAGAPDEFGNGALYLVGRNIAAFPQNYDTVMMPQAILLEEGKKTSVCLADSGGTIKLIQIEDDFPDPDGSTATLRFVNLDEGNPNLTFRSANGAITSSAAFLQASAFAGFGPGVYDLEVIDGGGGVIGTLSQFALGGGGVYTFYYSGGALNHYRN